MGTPYQVVLCTCPDQSVAEQIAATLVSEKLAACVNIIPDIVSVYSWEGNVQRDAEWLLIIKTRNDIYPLVEGRVTALHPYTVPEVIAVPLEQGSKPYLDWINVSLDETS
jgi:periplasmic divalent cation tolerance protein